MTPLPRQPEVNIGMIGHVDHGKCLHPSERVNTDLGLLGMEELLEDPGRELGPAWDGTLYDPGIRVRGVGPSGPAWRKALLYIEDYSGPLVSLEVGGRRHLTTPHHRFWTPAGWRPAGSLSPGEAVLAEEGWLRVERRDLVDYSGPIVDLTVPETANFLLGEEGILVHNTTLTKAITGVWTDKHSEEIMRGITIKLGYADAAIFRCAGIPEPEAYTTDPSTCPGEAELKRVISIVDAPGHETLMGTMLSGAAIMDGAILVIAANEPCPRPQTREHLTAVQIIGVRDIVVAQNKVDVVDDRRAYENYEEIRRFLSETPYADAPIIPISAQHNANIDVLLQAVVERIRVPERDLKSPPLMYIVRSFDVNKPGTRPRDLVGGVVGGSILRGKLRVGDEIEIRPGLEHGPGRPWEPIRTVITSLVSGGAPREEVGPGGLVGIGTKLDPSYTKSDGLIGRVLGHPGEMPDILLQLQVEYHLLDRVVGLEADVKVEPLRVGEIVTMNVGSATTIGMITRIRESVAEIKLKIPVAAEPGQRVAISRRIRRRWRLIGYGFLL